MFRSRMKSLSGGRQRRSHQLRPTAGRSRARCRRPRASRSRSSARGPGRPSRRTRSRPRSSSSPCRTMPSRSRAARCGDVSPFVYCLRVSCRLRLSSSKRESRFASALEMSERGSSHARPGTCGSDSFLPREVEARRCLRSRPWDRLLRASSVLSSPTPTTTMKTHSTMTTPRTTGSVGFK
jgi:hypothetical protein